MPSLSTVQRKTLENAVRAARRVAETGARAALKSLVVDEAEAHSGLSAAQKNLRTRLRAHGRQLGDQRDERRATQSIDRLISECAYEHWHRLLFARFLAENALLIEPDNNVAISLADCRELARGRGVDPLVLASSFAERMLPQIFRTNDPVLEIQLPPETRQELEGLVEGLSPDVFTADDSLGWTYQFWQADRKKEVNDSGVKIGSKELPAVTQLFTEDYMVLFLLHNTLGAWWTAKRKSEGKSAELPGYEWTYLRLVDGGSPAAGSFEGWPKRAQDVKLLDPCMGSGHFLIFALPILVGFRMEEDGLALADAVDAVLRENLFGLEIDPRCTQIAAFNLALTAWRLGARQGLPALNLACSGLGPNAPREDWVKLGSDDKLRRGMEHLHQMFQQAPDLGSLINPGAATGELFVADFGVLQPLLDKALAKEKDDYAALELAVAAKGAAKAAQILADRFTLVATNVPYLGRGKQSDLLKQYCDRVHPDAKADLATCFVERCLDFCATGGSVALVTPQNWLFLGTYKKLRRRLLQNDELNCVTRLGPNAFRDMNWWAATTALLSISRRGCSANHAFAGLDVADCHEPDEKAEGLCLKPIAHLNQRDQLDNPDARLSMGDSANLPLLKEYADCLQGTTTGDNPRYVIQFWELPAVGTDWELFQATVENTQHFGGREDILRWQSGRGELAASSEARVQGQALFGRVGVFVGQMRELPVTFFSGQFYNMNGAALVPRKLEHLPAIWAFCSSPEFRIAVRELDQALKVTNATLVKVPFDLSHWQKVAAANDPDGLPKPHSNDPTQWLFGGHPRSADKPLQVAVGRLLGYRWPRQTGSSFPDCPALDQDGLDRFEDEDGIVCLPALKREAPAATRLRDLLAFAFGKTWSSAKQSALLADVGFAGSTLEDWIRDGFFEQHCEVFHQRPFIWHVWDGIKKGGFSALVNYHKLAGPGGQGRRTLEALIYSYLGDWITQQRAEQKAGTEGAEGRLAAAENLKVQLLKILEGEPPYDIFVRWKPLHEQPIGWEPDINDGVRMNVRPFLSATLLNGGRAGAGVLRVKPKGIKWDKDRGTEPERSKDEYPWFWSWDGESEDFAGGRKFDGSRWNDVHYTRARKKQARQDARGRREKR